MGAAVFATEQSSGLAEKSVSPGVIVVVAGTSDVARAGDIAWANRVTIVVAVIIGVCIAIIAWTISVIIGVTAQRGARQDACGDARTKSAMETAAMEVTACEACAAI